MIILSLVCVLILSLVCVAVVSMMLAIWLPASRRTTGPASKPSALAFTVQDISGKEVSLAQNYAGKVVLVVNVASKCGYTPQYKGLEALYEKYSAKGLAILGFPCNQFGGQEPGTNQEIQQFCQTNFNVKFDLFDKIDVNGDKASPLYKYLTGPDISVQDKGAVKWNFEKFLIGKDGQVTARYRSAVQPEDIDKDIEASLAK
jgi:glutathione peroxidase